MKENEEIVGVLEGGLEGKMKLKSVYTSAARHQMLLIDIIGLASSQFLPKSTKNKHPNSLCRSLHILHATISQTLESTCGHLSLSSRVVTLWDCVTVLT